MYCALSVDTKNAMLNFAYYYISSFYIMLVSHRPLPLHQATAQYSRGHRRYVTPTPVHTSPQEQLLLVQILLEVLNRRSIADFPLAKTLGKSRRNPVGIADGSKRDEVGATGEVVEQLGLYLRSQACFAHTPGAGERKQADLWAPQEGAGQRQFVLAPNHLNKSSLMKERDRKVMW